MDIDTEVHRVWSLLSEVSDQLNQNRSSAVNLHSLTDGVKGQAIHSQTGFVLRRFNLDKPKEVYDAELERMNAAMSAENQALLNDNRQLSALIREYEQTLENVMTTFRVRAHEVQQRELALMRQYESILVERETEALDENMKVNNVRSESLARVSRMLRVVLRKLGGEDVQIYEAHMAATARKSAAPSRQSSTSAPGHGGDSGEAESTQTDKGKNRDEGAFDQDRSQSPEADVAHLLEEEEDSERRLAAAEWALERESELARLERENEELRALVSGLLNPNSTSSATLHRATESSSSSAARIPVPIPDQPSDEQEGQTSDEQSLFATGPRHRILGGPPGTVGPFGTYKRNTLIRVDSR